MFVSTFAAGILAFSGPVGDTEYKTQLEALVGQSYQEAVSLLGMPVARDLRDGGGEIWTFRRDRRSPDQWDGRTMRDRGAVGQHIAFSRGSGAPDGGSNTARAQFNLRAGTQHAPIALCTTRVALDAEGQIIDYAFYGDCYALR
ncbi:MAG: hypothetical protein CMH94_01460 [Oceanicaulis sp.]|nr:hypothetical protein [Oceanicaulis sp.]MAZ91263.1 hypothetical protein [Maricaulis sp.]MBI74254.1 hypothetical protein [Oceanicaulis sp.]